MHRQITGDQSNSMTVLFEFPFQKFGRLLGMAKDERRADAERTEDVRKANVLFLFVLAVHIIILGDVLQILLLAFQTNNHRRWPRKASTDRAPTR